MSEPYAETGRSEQRTCPRCGASVEHRESMGIYGSGPAWHCEPHNAPCGLPCMGGGVSGRAYRSGQVHGLWGYPERHYPGTEWQDAVTVPASEGTACPACGAHGTIEEGDHE